MTLDEARPLEYGSRKGARFTGEPLHGEVFDLAEKANMGELLGFTCVRLSYLERVASRFPQAAIHYDGSVDEARLAEIAPRADGHRLIVWMPFENRLTSWCRTPPLSEERVRLARKLGAWILEDEGELRQVCEVYRADVAETTGALKPDGWKEHAK